MIFSAPVVFQKEVTPVIRNCPSAARNPAVDSSLQTFPANRLRLLADFRESEPVTLVVMEIARCRGVQEVRFSP